MQYRFYTSTTETENVLVLLHGSGWHSMQIYQFEDFAEFEEITEIKDMFEDLKVIWDSKNEEKLYAVNENLLYQQIKRKEKSVSHSLQRFEMFMIGVNIIIAVTLVGVGTLNDGGFYGYLLSGIYLAYTLLAIFWRQTRRQKDTLFEQTMMGELNRTIWQASYLIERSRGLIWWYLLPLIILIAGPILYRGQSLFALAFIIFMGGVSIFATRREIKKKYLPQKHSLESLRATLLAADA